MFNAKRDNLAIFKGKAVEGATPHWRPDFIEGIMKLKAEKRYTPFLRKPGKISVLIFAFLLLLSISFILQHMVTPKNDLKRFLLRQKIKDEKTK